MSNPQVGDSFPFKPTAFTEHSPPSLNDKLNGKIVYVNYAHRYYTAEAECNGWKVRESWKF